MKKQRLAVDACTGMMMASTLTGNDVGDPSQVATLLDQIEATIATVAADGAYDGMPTYGVVAVRDDDIRVIIPTPVTAVLSDQAQAVKEEPAHFSRLPLKDGWAGKKRPTTANALWLKPRWAATRPSSNLARARSFSGQKAEAAVGVAALNRMPDTGRTDSVRRQKIAAQICWEKGKLDLCATRATMHIDIQQSLRGKVFA